MFVVFIGVFLSSRQFPQGVLEQGFELFGGGGGGEQFEGHVFLRVLAVPSSTAMVRTAAAKRGASPPTSHHPTAWTARKTTTSRIRSLVDSAP